MHLKTFKNILEIHQLNSVNRIKFNNKWTANKVGFRNTFFPTESGLAEDHLTSTVY